MNKFQLWLDNFKSTKLYEILAILGTLAVIIFIFVGIATI